MSKELSMEKREELRRHLNDEGEALMIILDAVGSKLSLSSLIAIANQHSDYIIGYTVVQFLESKLDNFPLGKLLDIYDSIANWQVKGLLLEKMEPLVKALSSTKLIQLVVGEYAGDGCIANLVIKTGKLSIEELIKVGAKINSITSGSGSLWQEVAKQIIKQK